MGVRYLRRGSDIQKLSIGAAAAVLVAAFLIFHPWIHPTLASPGKALYSSDVYQVAFEYPEDWKPVPGYAGNRYEGTDGYFEASAVGSTLDLSSIVGNETAHVLHPYGSSPTITYMTIAGSDAALIMPSDDQDDSMHHQAALLVAYPQEVNVDGVQYFYFVLWADANHIQEIGDSLRYIR